MKRDTVETHVMIQSVRQAAAVPVRDGLVCLVTSRNGRRWVFPKGGIELGQTAAEAALVESWEEAGLVGTLGDGPVGSYHYKKNGFNYHVTVFVMRVSAEKAEWPERATRKREWVTVEEAISRIDEPDLRDLLRGVSQSSSEVVGRI
ncbi:NUDIX hydrolase [Fimbriiglobus ruber]|uniref:Hydrolase, NUDIX family n=1 Tax=Fimbriiglobus ruber TaxID=1908690 RepID=A0A225E866_9BACT|nr:NUDIX hydrolase [Fimbriiglobus ruber]OWK46968.1 Hydrolase, NUDIX family [Fimbriiglobus ruber]